MFSILSLMTKLTLRKVSTLACVALILLGMPSAALSQGNVTVYFYNPEINTTRNVVLKTVFDQYLKEKGSFKFQPVDNKRTFESLLKTDNNAVFMISDWHFQQLKERSISAVSVLRGVKDGNDTFRKFLVTRDPDAELNSLTIATSGTALFSRSILADIYPNIPPSQLAQPTLLLVPKDIDALMAVGFGLADAAIASELSLKTLSTLYAHQYQQLHIVGHSQPLKRLLVVHQKGTAYTKDVIAALHNMSRSSKGLRALNTLGLNSWQLIDNRANTDGRPAK